MPSVYLKVRICTTFESGPKLVEILPILKTDFITTKFDYFDCHKLSIKAIVDIFHISMGNNKSLHDFSETLGSVLKYISKGIFFPALAIFSITSYWS